MPIIAVPIDLNAPRITTLGGNSFWSVLGLTAVDLGCWSFVKDVDGKIYGVSDRIDLQGGSFSSAQLRLIMGWNATTGVSRMSVGYKEVGDAESLNPASLTTIAAQDVTVPATAYLEKQITFTGITGLATGDVVLVELFHEGAHANDTVATNTLLLAAILEITTA